MSPADYYLERLRWYTGEAGDHCNGLCYCMERDFPVTGEEDYLDAHDAFPAAQNLARALLADANPDNRAMLLYIANWPVTAYLTEPGRTPRRVDLARKLATVIAAHPEQFNAHYALESLLQ